MDFNYIAKKGIKVTDYEKISNQIRALILKTRPDEILVHDPNDTNQEHSLVYNIVKTASRRLPLNLIRFRSVSSSNDFKANLYVDIKDYISLKQESLKFHKSQQFHEYFNDDYIVSFHNNFFAYNRGIKISEVYFEEFKFK